MFISTTIHGAYDQQMTNKIKQNKKVRKVSTYITVHTLRDSKFEHKDIKSFVKYTHNHSFFL